jgi:hypothetical protein
MDYATLQTTIADFLNRKDLTEQIPTFIELAEARIRRDLRDRRQEVRAEATVFAEYMALPCDHIETIRVIADDKILRLADKFNIERFEILGPMSFYRHFNDQLQFMPAPDPEKGARVVLEYIAEVTPCSTESPTNWLLEQSPDVYLYGALLAAEGYLHDDGRIPIWSQAYGEAVSALNMASDKAEYSGTALRLQRHGVS